MSKEREVGEFHREMVALIDALQAISHDGLDWHQRLDLIAVVSVHLSTYVDRHGCNLDADEAMRGTGITTVEKGGECEIPFAIKDEPVYFDGVV